MDHMDQHDDGARARMARQAIGHAEFPRTMHDRLFDWLDAPVMRIHGGEASPTISKAVALSYV